VEPIVPPPSPRHLAAQQLLALALQKRQVGRNAWATVFQGLQLASTDELIKITDWMVQTGHVDQDSGMMFVGPEAERRYGHRHFMELLSIFTSAPQFAVLQGRREIGTVDPFVLIRKVNGPRVIALGGRGWLVSAVDWSRRKAYVEPTEARGDARWISVAHPQNFALVDAQRRILLGVEPAGTRLSRRAHDHLHRVRSEWSDRVDNNHTLIRTDGARTRWWTWAGGGRTQS
jgi:ATP-dependent Lhr-like helicase